MINYGHPPDPSKKIRVHASAVCVDGSALIFLGPSKAGKSTICRLLSRHATPWADDKLYLISQANGEWSVASADNRNLGKPPSGQEDSSLECVPLKAIFRLYQALEPHLERISEIETCCHLAKAFFELSRQQRWDIKIKRRAFASLATITRSVPGYRLYFNLSTETYEVIRSCIGP